MSILRMNLAHLAQIIGGAVLGMLIGSAIGYTASALLLEDLRCVPGECLGATDKAFIYCPPHGWRLVSK